MVSMNQMADMCIELAGKTGKLTKKHVPGPEGVRGRNSDNTLIKKVLGWAPSVDLKTGLKITMDWIAARIEEKKAAGIDEDYTSSKIVQQTTESLDSLN